MSADKVDKIDDLSREELCQMISKLQTQVSNLESEVNILKKGSGSSSDGKTEKGSRKKKPKASRPFDFKRFNKRHIALRIAYLGWNYHGFAAQENIKTTIEFHLFEALVKTRLIEDRSSSNYSRCGRTDKGVSAFGQVIALDVRTNLQEGMGVIRRDNSAVFHHKSDRDVKEIDYVTVLNRVLPSEIRVLAWAPVDPSFSARFDCQYRTYKYFFPRGNLDIQIMKEASQKLIGEHDFRNFCKRDVANGVVTFIRRIVSVDIQPLDDREDDYQMYEVTVSGLAFLYHQIRCIVAILFMIGQHKENVEIIDELLDVSKNPCKPQYSMAAEYPLVLYDCGFDGIKWIYSDDNQQHNITLLQSIWTNHCIRATIVKRMLDGLDVAPVKNTNVTSESLEDRIAHFTKKGRGPKVKPDESYIPTEDGEDNSNLTENMDST